LGCLKVIHTNLEVHKHRKIEVKSKKSKAAVLLGGLIGGDDKGVKEEDMNSGCACLVLPYLVLSFN
jgi:hypothetical protein